ncbi:MAG: glutathione S-transferase family protein [Pseudomonadota bacterium]
MTYRLHNRLGSGGFAIQATLAAAKIDFAYQPLASVPNQPLGALVQDVNRWGQVPVLELADGTRLTEVAAILAHLSYAEEKTRDGPTLWIDNHPLFLRWAVFLAVNVYEGILRCSYADRYFSEVPGEAHLQETEGVAQPIRDGIKRAATDRIHAAFQCIEEETRGHQFLLSDRLSPCDIFLAMLYAWHNQKPDLPKCTWITTQVATHSEIRQIWAQNFHDRLDFKWHEL